MKAGFTLIEMLAAIAMLAMLAAAAMPLMGRLAAGRSRVNDQQSARMLLQEMTDDQLRAALGGPTRLEAHDGAEVRAFSVQATMLEEPSEPRSGRADPATKDAFHWLPPQHRWMVVRVVEWPDVQQRSLAEIITLAPAIVRSRHAE